MATEVTDQEPVLVLNEKKYIINDLSDEAFVEVLRRALWKIGKTVEIQGDSYQIFD